VSEDLELFTKARVGHLATADRAGRPHVVPICFVWLASAIYTPIDRKPKRESDPRRLRRVRNLSENSRAAVVVDRWDEDWSRLAYAMVEGPATVLRDGAEWDAAAAALTRKYTQYAALPLAGCPIIRIAAERITAWRARS
jgi:PPOX class probable F420-dependent enzyme